MIRFGRLISLLLIPLIVLIIYSALKSYLFRAPPSWTFEMSIFLFGSFFMLGSAYCLKLRGHVAVDIIRNYLPEKGKKVQTIFTYLVILFVSLTLLYVSVPTAIKSTQILERSVLQTTFNPHVWWFRWVIPISSALIAGQCFKEIWDCLCKKSTSNDQ